MGTATGLQTVFGISKGMLSVKHHSPQILMTVNYCWRQLAQRLGWAETAYLKKEGAASHPGASKHSLQYDRRSNWHFDGEVGKWNIGNSHLMMSEGVSQRMACLKVKLTHVGSAA